MALKKWEPYSNLSLEVCMDCFTQWMPLDSSYQGAAAMACLRPLFSHCHPQAAAVDSYLGEAEVTRIYLVASKQRVLRAQHEGAEGIPQLREGRARLSHESSRQ